MRQQAPVGAEPATRKIRQESLTDKICRRSLPPSRRVTRGWDSGNRQRWSRNREPSRR